LARGNDDRDGATCLVTAARCASTDEAVATKLHAEMQSGKLGRCIAELVVIATRRHHRFQESVYGLDKAGWICWQRRKNR